ncbi:parallel beta helix pectate lyase-like protein [Pseudaminobacter salicylatoxidans]|uniref:Parallel beta helix pectate lyase-like protein n=1 Tax=Pseudaminobacter salicylatoxidans TaxID=93369 RepID=A0A316C4G0_PSESE|nr:right-handed parallel beta-helix repeat-containing protein [Pseudaminobacter salicylatoxidans]PWJ80652.1 parallel beta helix pectate lyase-like protein [Pseudaminobacter salicylatoxidans]
MAQTADTVFRDFVTDGVPASGAWQPKKVEVRELLTGYEAVINASLSSGSSLAFASKATLDASLQFPSATMAWVITDGVATNNGIYRKTGAAGAGAWTKLADLPYSFIRASNIGSGASDAIRATSSIPVPSADGVALIAVNVTVENTGPTTISFNGDTPLTIVTPDRTPLQAGDLTADMLIAGYRVGSEFRLITDPSSIRNKLAARAAQTASEEAQAAAEAARDIAAGYASDAVSQGNVPIYATVAGMGALSVPTGIEGLRVNGFTATGDGGDALYRKVGAEPSHAAKFQSADGAWWEIAEQRITPAMIGVARNSALDQSPKLQAWLDVLRLTGAEGYVPAGVYKLDTEISTNQSGLRVECHRKALFDMTASATSSFGVTVSGTIGVFANITVGNAQLGAARVRSTSVFAQSLAVGDVVKIKSADIYDSFNTNMTYGELNVVTGLADAATGYIDLEIPLSATYGTSPQIAKVTAVADVKWIAGAFIGRVGEQNNQKAFRLRLAKDFQIESISGERMDDRVFWLEDCMKGEIVKPVCKDARPSSTGYGVSVIDACQDISIHHGEFSRVRHALSTNNQTANGGIPRRISFADNRVSGGAWARGGSMGPGDAIDTHAAAEDIYIERNTTIGSPGQGINFECRSGVIRDNKVINPAGNGISVHNESDLNGSMIVSGNVVSRAGGKGMYIVNGTRGTLSNYDSLVVDGNIVDGATSEGIQIGYSAQAGKVLGLVMSGNRVRNNGGYGVLVYHTRRAAISANAIDGVARNALRIIDSLAFTVNGNIVSLPSGATQAAILVSASTVASSTFGNISGNTVSPQTSSFSGPGVALENNVTQTGVFSNTLRGTGGVSLGTGTGTGNAQANNIT